MKKKILKCAVVGLGRIGWQFHLPQIMRQDGFSLAAVVDPDEERLAEARERYGVTKLCRDCAELSPEEIDLAVISSPTRFHCPQTLFFLENGVDVFCDKPLALSAAEALRMDAAMKKSGRKLMVYQPHRLTSEALTARAILDSGRLGSLFMIRRSSGNYSRRNDWQAVAANGGGMLFNYGAHYIDQMFYLAGDRCERAKCELRRILSLGNADDMVRALITGRKGILYDLDINMSTVLLLPSLVLYGTLGTAMTLPDGRWKVRFCRGEELPAISMQNGLSAWNREYPSEKLPWHEEIVSPVPENPDEYYQKCYEYYALDAPPFVPLCETLEIMRTLELCRSSAMMIKPGDGTPQPEGVSR